MCSLCSGLGVNYFADYKYILAIHPYILSHYINLLLHAYMSITVLSWRMASTQWLFILNAGKVGLVDIWYSLWLHLDRDGQKDSSTCPRQWFVTLPWWHISHNTYSPNLRLWHLPSQRSSPIHICISLLWGISMLYYFRAFFDKTVFLQCRKFTINQILGRSFKDAHNLMPGCSLHSDSTV
jgi:hypothetical protein